MNDNESEIGRGSSEEARSAPPVTRQHTRMTSRASLLPTNPTKPKAPSPEANSDESDEDDLDLEDELAENELIYTPTRNRRNTSRSATTFRYFATEKSVVETSKSAYIYAICIALPISLICFTVQTELAQYIQAKLHYEKPYFMLYITHGSWWLNGIGMWVWLRLRNWSTPSSTTTIRMWKDCIGTAKVIAVTAGYPDRSPILHMMIIVCLCGICLTIAGATWYVAVNLTTAADLSAIYNSSAFFAYAFSIPILHDRIRLDKVSAVALSIVGVIVIAYGDREITDGDTASTGTRALGNLIIAVGAVLYGLYEVLYKKYGCPPDHYDPHRSIVFANAVATGLGIFTVTVMWIPIPILHILGWETFEIPPKSAVLALLASIAANFVYSSCLLAMISLTSPVLSSVACLLSIFVVAIVDTHITGEPLTAAALIGGLLISIGFALLSYATYVEMKEEAQSKMLETEEADEVETT